MYHAARVFIAVATAPFGSTGNLLLRLRRRLLTLLRHAESGAQRWCPASFSWR